MPSVIYKTSDKGFVCRKKFQNRQIQLDFHHVHSDVCLKRYFQSIYRFEKVKECEVAP